MVRLNLGLLDPTDTRMRLLLLDILPQDKRPWAALAVAVFAVTYLMLKPKMRFGGRKDPLRDPAKFGTLAQQRSVERQMENLLVELSEMARQITGQLDTRAAKLELLISQADERLEQLRGVNEANATPASSSSSSSRVTSEFLFPVDAAATPPAAEVATDVPRMKISRSDETGDPRHAEIYRLVD